MTSIHPSSLTRNSPTLFPSPPRLPAQSRFLKPPKPSPPLPPSIHISAPVPIPHFSPNTLSSNHRPKTSNPGLPTQTRTRFPKRSLNQFPASSPTAPASSSRFFLFRRSTTQHPRVHCPLVSTRTSRTSARHPPMCGAITYHMHSGSCSCRPTASPVRFGVSDSILWKVELRNAVLHSARGEGGLLLPLLGGERRDAV